MLVIAWVSIFLQKLPVMLISNDISIPLTSQRFCFPLIEWSFFLFYFPLNEFPFPFIPESKGQGSRPAPRAGLPGVGKPTKVPSDLSLCPTPRPSVTQGLPKEGKSTKAPSGLQFPLPSGRRRLDLKFMLRILKSWRKVMAERDIRSGLFSKQACD